MTPRASPIMASSRARAARRVTLLLLGLLAGWYSVVCISLVAAFHGVGYGFRINPEQIDLIYNDMRLCGWIVCLTTAAILVIRRRTSCSLGTLRVSLALSAALTLISFDRIAGICYAPPSTRENIYFPHPVRGWQNRPGMVGTYAGAIARINQWGFRGPDFPRSKDDAETRLLMMGDSTTFGFALTDEQTYPHKLEDFLNRMNGGTRIRCLNAGVCGYGIWQSLHLLRTEAVEFEPDLLILGFCLNDLVDRLFIRPDNLGNAAFPFDFVNARHPSGIVRAILSIRAERTWNETRSTLARLIDPANPRPAGDISTCTQYLFTHPEHPDVQRGWNLTLSDLDEWNDFCKERNLTWVLALFPMKGQILSASPNLAPQQRLTEWALDRKVPAIDLFHSIQRTMQEEGRPVDTLMIDELHFSEAGNQLIVESLGRFLFEHRLMPPARTAAGGV